MSTVRFWFVRTFRSRLRGYASVAVLLALLGGLTMASFAGARRTASAYPRFREVGRALDVQLFGGEFEREHPGLAGRLPGVAAALVVLANLVAAAPARMAGRTPVATILRSE